MKGKTLLFLIAALAVVVAFRMHDVLKGEEELLSVLFNGSVILMCNLRLCKLKSSSSS